MNDRLRFRGDFCTTAMGILPHRNVDDALRCALSVDIPFWPQLPRLSWFEDMYVQAMDRFPGAVFDKALGRVWIDTGRFMDELPAYLEAEERDATYALLSRTSVSYERFLECNLGPFPAIHGQVISPVSLCLKLVDEKGMPVVYNDGIRSVVFSFLQKKVNVQWRELRAANEKAFVWIDDPGLEFVFSAMSGYDSVKAKKELSEFFEGVEGPRGLHLCGRPDWDFLLTLDIDILSLNAYAFGDLFVAYDRVVDFLRSGRMVSWGIVPTGMEDFEGTGTEGLTSRLESMWARLTGKGLAMEEITEGSILAPATCNLANADETVTVERAFGALDGLSDHLKNRYRL